MAEMKGRKRVKQKKRGRQHGVSLNPDSFCQNQNQNQAHHQFGKLQKGDFKSKS